MRAPLCPLASWLVPHCISPNSDCAISRSAVLSAALDDTRRKRGESMFGSKWSLPIPVPCKWLNKETTVFKGSDIPRIYVHFISPFNVLFLFSFSIIHAFDFVRRKGFNGSASRGINNNIWDPVDARDGSGLVAGRVRWFERNNRITAQYYRMRGVRFIVERWLERDETHV